MFNLTKATALLANVNPRMEIHGDQQKLAADLKFVVTVPNTALDAIDPNLRPMLFARTTGEAVQQGELLGTDHLPAVRFPSMKPVSLENEYEGCTVALTSEFAALDEKLGKTKVGKFTIAPKDGGSAEISFTVKCNPDGAAVGRLCDYIQKDVILTLKPPKSDGSGAKKISEKAAAAADAGQRDLVQDAETQANVDKANAVATALTGQEQPALEFAPDDGKEIPDDEVLRLLAQRGYHIPLEVYGDAGKISDADVDAIVEYIRGKRIGPPDVLDAYFSPAPTAQDAHGGTPGDADDSTAEGEAGNAVADGSGGGIGEIEQVDTPTVTLDPPKGAGKATKGAATKKAAAKKTAAKKTGTRRSMD